MLYPDEFSGSLKEQEILFAAERTIEIAHQEAEGNDEKACQLIIAHLSTLCYNQGVERFIATITGQKLPSIDSDECMYGAVMESQKLWEWVADYCRDTKDIHLHPLGMLMFLRYTSSPEDPNDDDMALVKAIDRYAAELEKKLKEESRLTDDTPVAVPDIENFSGDDTVLMVEFFKLMEEIGTFYHDRSRYDSDEKRALHDRIVAIHNRITNSH